MPGLPNGLIAYGPDSNCTLTGPTTCPVSASVYEYRPTLPGNATFITLINALSRFVKYKELTFEATSHCFHSCPRGGAADSGTIQFGISMIIHAVQGIKYKTWAFMIAMGYGCICEMIGYGGRIMLWESPFSFTGFLMQIICVTLGPTFFTAAIYLTLSKIVLYLGPQYSRFSPKFYYWIFIPCDIFSLCLQAVGGALSSTSSGGSKVAVDVSIAGLSLQVFFICVFVTLVLEYASRWRKGRQVETDKIKIPRSFFVFVAFLSIATILILIRCCYRIDELSDGYNGPLIHNEGLFIGLEGVMVIVAAFCLNVAHPGPVFGHRGSCSTRDEGRVMGEPKV